MIAAAAAAAMVVMNVERVCGWGCGPIATPLQQPRSRTGVRGGAAPRPARSGASAAASFRAAPPGRNGALPPNPPAGIDASAASQRDPQRPDSRRRDLLPPPTAPLPCPPRRPRARRQRTPDGPGRGEEAVDGLLPDHVPDPCRRSRRSHRRDLTRHTPPPPPNLPSAFEERRARAASPARSPALPLRSTKSHCADASFALTTRSILRAQTPKRSGASAGGRATFPRRGTGADATASDASRRRPQRRRWRRPTGGGAIGGEKGGWGGAEPTPRRGRCGQEHTASEASRSSGSSGRPHPACTATPFPLPPPTPHLRPMSGDGKGGGGCRRGALAGSTAGAGHGGRPSR